MGLYHGTINVANIFIIVVFVDIADTVVVGPVIGVVVERVFIDREVW